MPVCDPDSTTSAKLTLLFSVLGLGVLIPGVLSMLSAYHFYAKMDANQKKMPLHWLSLIVLISMVLERGFRFIEFHSRFYLGFYDSQALYATANLFLYSLVISLFGGQVLRLHVAFKGTIFEPSKKELRSLALLVAVDTFGIVLWTTLNGINPVALHNGGKITLLISAIIIVIFSSVLQFRLDYDFVHKLRQVVAQQQLVSRRPPGLMAVQNSNTVSTLSSRHLSAAAARTNNQRDSPIPTIHPSTPSVREIITLNDNPQVPPDTPVSTGPVIPLTPVSESRATMTEARGSHGRGESLFGDMERFRSELSQASLSEFPDGRDILEAAVKSTVISLHLTAAVFVTCMASILWIYSECEGSTMGHGFLNLAYLLIGLCMYATLNQRAYESIFAYTKGCVSRIVAFQTRVQIAQLSRASTQADTL